MKWRNGKKEQIIELVGIEIRTLKLKFTSRKDYWEKKLMTKYLII